jgi:peptidoglycan/xylan/chitin deacetylase (PgdA/CDA1 family)
MYHRVLTTDEMACTSSAAGIVVSRNTFQQHLAFLSRHFTVLRPEMFLDHLRARKAFPTASCLITFDDGWSDNYSNAYPLLKQAGVSATIFLPTAFIDTPRQFWQERMTRLLMQLHKILCSNTAAPVIKVGQQDLRDLLRGSPDKARGAIDQFVRSFKNQSMSEIDQLLEDLESTVNTRRRDTMDAGLDGFMNWDQIRRMAADGIAFGSHAVTHRLLDQLELPAVEVELTESRAVIEQHIEKPVNLLAYPNGNHNPDVARCAERCGYAAAFTTRPGSVSAMDNPYTLVRVNVHEGFRHPPVLMAVMLGIF